ncbi:MAG: T9SS type A sorting domain-containing protein [Gemmatimonadetes bacterium]|nr:T9SS type A sorting domain-containing protein [Gemmatimonadota bacterium]MBT4612511.1 T9SS type A sorting domain-containing protein [Gemmatimonadota bacterium]MBT5058922.1 T9SS type A sorting domain-containing protein [Gemmatimonadota bacterium]MBT5144370.1 T9SS type A sorting domain-containing protein [Gemmatimonadota bacterium]MBT5587112.1 T9SS type A sorting domain-containing protein [Gemmatimonadota bacterium]
MTVLSLLSGLFLGGATSVAAQETPRVGQHAYRADVAGSMVNYLLFLPETYGQNPDKRWPILIYLHGSDLVGDRPEILRAYGPPAIVDEEPGYPFILLSPQATTNYTLNKETWREEQMRYRSLFSGLLDQVIESYAVDVDRVALTGLSMGAFTAWHWATVEPERFSAVLLDAGGGDPATVTQFRDLPIWAFHGAADGQVPPTGRPIPGSTGAAEKLRGSLDMIAAQQQIGGNARLTLVPDRGHGYDTDEPIHGDPDVIEWLLAQRRRRPRSPLYIDHVTLTPAIVTHGRGSEIVVTASTRSGDENGTIRHVTARLEDEIDPQAIDLTDDGTDPDRVAGDGQFSGWFSMPVETGEGLRKMRVELEDDQRRISTFFVYPTVAPEQDYQLYGDGLADGWEARGLWTTVDVAGTTEVYEGEVSMSMVATQTSGYVHLDCPEPVPMAGYESLRFAFHPGDTEPTETTDYNVEINGFRPGAVDLLQPIPEGSGIDPDQRAWQNIIIPLGSNAIFDDLTSLRFTGRLRGSFYIDDVRLVGTRGDLNSTAVLEHYSAAIPVAPQLSQNYPNPFNPETVIRFVLPRGQEVDLVVNNLVGQRVATLVSGYREAGTYSLTWDGRDDRGMMLASGTYLYRLRTTTGIQTRKLVLVR